MASPSITLNSGRKIGTNEATFIIAEIGQNHQGDINLAKELIKLAKDSGADCVKFQKTNLSSKFTQKKLNEVYDSINSFGHTYGEHKMKLEFNEQQFIELQNYAQQLNILFTASAMDGDSLNFLISINVPFIKIGSGDTNNFPLIEKASKCKLPIFLSTGMFSLDTVFNAYDILRHGHPFHLCPMYQTSSGGSNNGHSVDCINKSRSDVAIMHCVSSYPTPINEINLNVINLYKKLFPEAVIGYSGHEEGIEVSFAAATKLNASIIERHLTLDKKMKGTDHKCSLDGNQFKELVQKIRSFEANEITEEEDLDTIEPFLGTEEKKRQESEISCWNKLGKSVVSSKVLEVGHVIGSSDLLVKVATEPKGIPGELFYDVIGKRVVERIDADEAIQWHQIL